MVFFWLGMASEHQFASVCRWKMHIEHLDAANFSSAERGVSPGAKRLRRAFKVACKQ